MDRIQNHKKSGSVTDTYDRYQYGPELQRAMEKVAAHIIALVESRPDNNVVPLTRR